MKSKPLFIAATILVTAIILTIFVSRDKESGELGQNDTSQAERSTTRDDNKPGPRSARRNAASSDEESLPVPQRWADQINTLLGDDAITVPQAAAGMLKIVGNQSAPLPARQEALDHALNLTSDNSHVALQALIKSGNGKLPRALAQTILDDSYNRPGEIQVNTALKVLQAGYENIDEEENINEEAIELLHFHLEPERDPGKDIQAWEKEIDVYIQKQYADEVEEEE